MTYRYTPKIFLQILRFRLWDYTLLLQYKYFNINISIFQFTYGTLLTEYGFKKIKIKNKNKKLIQLATRAFGTTFGN
jgi:hypothetical protein